MHPLFAPCLHVFDIEWKREYNYIVCKTLVGGIHLGNTRLKVIIIFVIAFCILNIAGCDVGQDIEVNESDKRIVAVTIVPQKTFVEAVCGDLVEVVVMVPPGNSPSNYEPIPSEMGQFSEAEVYFAIGVPTEEANILPITEEFKNMKVVKLQEEILKEYPEREFSSGERDPHIWLSPKRVKGMVSVIAREMMEIDPANEDQYQNNAQNYISKLETLDQQIKDVVNNMESKKIIVFHPAFGYLADDYGIQMYALEQNGKEATPQRLMEMIDLAKEEDIKVIFYQAEVSSRQAQAFAEEIGGKTEQLSPLSPNYIENLKNMVKTMAEVMK